MLEGLVLNRRSIVSVFLSKLLGVLDGLNDGLVVILVNLLVDGRGHLLVALRADMLLGDGGTLVLVDACLVLIVMRHEGRDGLLGLVHCEGCLSVTYWWLRW